MRTLSICKRRNVQICNTSLDKLIQQHSTLFRDKLGSLKGTTVKILISSDAQHTSLDKLIQQHSTLFNEKYTTINTTKGSMNVYLLE